MSVIYSIFYVIFWLASYLTSLIPLPIFDFLGKAFGIFLKFIGFRTKIVKTNMQLALSDKFSESEIKELFNLHFKHVGTLFLEIFRNFSLTAKRSLNEVQWPEKVVTLIKKFNTEKKGILVLTAHHGNWEMGAKSLSALGIPTCIAVKKMSGGLSHYLIERNRKDAGIELLYKGNVFRTMKKRLEEGKVVVFILDQHSPGKEGIRVPFMGVPAATNRGLSRLARLSGCPILPLITIRKENGKQKIHYGDLIHYQKGSIEEEKTKPRMLEEEFLNTLQYNQALEQMIMEKPEQWLWIHRRWKASTTPLNTEKPWSENLAT